MIERRSDWTDYRPAHDPYVAARVLEILPYLTGYRGKFIVGLFSYFRWVDDMADERDDLTKSQKLDFINRQIDIADAHLPDDLLPMEKIFSELPWDKLPEKEIRSYIKVLLASIAEDISHQGFIVRKDREIRHYNWRTVGPVVNILFLALNGHPPRVNQSLMRLLDAYIRIGSLEGLGDDLKLSVVKLPLQEKKDGTTSIGEVLQEYDEEKFNKTKRENLTKILHNVSSFAALDIPAWQKLACFTYIIGDVLIKKPLMVTRERALKKLVSP